ncbi:MAG: hypothetical protein AB8H47_29775 [Bacteroidia bacterium]
MRVIIFLVVLGLCCSCRTPQSNDSSVRSTNARPNVGRVEWIPNPEAVPDPSPALANVFAPWDGHWKGSFRIFQDTSGLETHPAKVRIEDPNYILKGPFKETMQIAVEQFYESTNPWRQTVKIIDTYTDGSGQVQKVESSGFNVVVGDSLFCIVNKPDEQVVHTGITRDPQIIIWERDLRTPLKIEYFFEQVQGDTYSILGWGYYGEDDPLKGPKSWFYGEYVKQ